MAGRHEQLRVYWSKRERDVMIYFPLGTCTSSDGHWISGVFDKAFTDELTKRGYDVSTLRFSVAIDFDGPRVEEKFKTLSQSRNS